MGNASVTADTLDRLSDRIRLDDPSLRSLWLEPDGKYQTRPFRLDDLTNRVASLLADDLHHLPADTVPHLYYGWGRCRVGSTALANLFGEAGIPSYFQPIKALMRNTLTDEPAGSWQPPSAHEHPAIFSKDVAGPYLMAECLYNPLQMLIEGGYPADRLHMILLDRDPVTSLASWLTKWSDRVPRDRLVTHFVLASLNAIRVERYARREGVVVTHYVHEASRDPLRAAAALFGHLGLSDRFSPQAVTDWGTVEAFDTDQSSLIFTKEPDVYFVPGIHRAGSGYRYIARDRGAVTDADIALLERMGVPALYEACATACVQDLGLPLNLTDTVLGRALSPIPPSSAPLPAHSGPVPCLVA